jgi:hypothetical protein
MVRVATQVLEGLLQRICDNGRRDAREPPP